jgi:hypothetical protein
VRGEVDFYGSALPLRRDGFPVVPGVVAQEKECWVSMASTRWAFETIERTGRLLGRERVSMFLAWLSWISLLVEGRVYHRSTIRDFDGLIGGGDRCGSG